MKYQVYYRFIFSDKSRSKWFLHSEHENMLMAKDECKRVKNHLGRNGGSVKIVTCAE